MKKPVIVYRLGSMGDTVAALPCFHRILDVFKGHEIVVLTNVPVSSKAAALEDILKEGGFIHRSITYRVGTRSVWGLLRLIAQVRATGADTVIYLQGGRGLSRARRDVAFFRVCGIKTIIGAPLTADLDQVRTLPNGEVEFEAQRLARCLSPLGDIDLDDPKMWDLNLTSSELAAGQAHLEPLRGQPFMAVNTGGKVAMNDWGEDNWRTMLSQLTLPFPLALVFVGAMDDRARADRLLAAWGGAGLNLCGKLAPRHTAAVLKRAALFAGHDSGPMHLAAAGQTRCVAVFSGFNKPKRWHPYGEGHRVLQNMDGVDKIRPEAVAAAIVEQLKAVGQGQPG